MIILHSCKVSIVKVASDFLNIGIEENPFAMKLIIEPISLISYGAFRVEQGTVPIHVVAFPLPVINTATLIVELPVPISFLVLNKSFVFGTIFIVLYNKTGVFYLGIFVFSFCYDLFRDWGIYNRY